MLGMPWVNEMDSLLSYTENSKADTALPVTLPRLWHLLPDDFRGAIYIRRKRSP